MFSFHGSTWFFCLPPTWSLQKIVHVAWPLPQFILNQHLIHQLHGIHDMWADQINVASVVIFPGKACSFFFSCWLVHILNSWLQCPMFWFTNHSINALIYSCFLLSSLMKQVMTPTAASIQLVLFRSPVKQLNLFFVKSKLRHFSEWTHTVKSIMIWGFKSLYMKI